ncbi:MAG: FGGY-family carbohydrate kinase, partial [Psychrosphaera sp.]|nr:FGGY-family carbohydrate kinase [Psychrosphaera sp.]
HDQYRDQELLSFFDIPESILPRIQNSASAFGSTEAGLLGPQSITINGVAGDQQAALFGQGCVTPGAVKNTYGTGCFMLMHTGNTAVASHNGLLTTIACSASGTPAYALEGSVFMAGAAVQWLRDEMQLIEKASETQAIAESIPHTSGVYVVPAFTGLGAPYWDMEARGAIVGLTRGSGKKQIIRATLEAIAYQTNDVLSLMEQESGVKVVSLKVDGGACANNFLMQFQADLLDINIIRPKNVDSTALGAALLAGINSGFWSFDNLPQGLKTTDRQFNPDMKDDVRQAKCEGWRLAINKVKTS